LTTTVTRHGLQDVTSATAAAVHRASQPGFGRWLNHVSSARGCERPIRLAGHLHTLNPTTGEILRSQSTNTLPDGVIYVPCGDRRASACPVCAETYRADTYHLIRAGLIGGKGVPDTVAAHPVVFATFTAPTFGPVHTRAIDPKTGKVKPCRLRRCIQRCPHGRIMACPQRHVENSPSIGQPFCPQCYDYAHHVVWNAWASELWRRTTITANRNLRQLAKARDVTLRLSFAKVAEYQTRELIHFHALIHLDAIDPTHPDTPLPPPPGITVVDLDHALTQAAATTSLTTPPHPQNPEGWQVCWGTQFDIRPVTSTGELTDTAVAGYLAKYLTKYLSKSIGQAAGLDEHATDAQRDHARRLHAELRITPCSPRCPIWLLYGIQPKGTRHSITPGRCKGKAHQPEHLGIAGRRVLVSRKWSNKTLDDHRAERGEFVRQLLQSAGIQPSHGPQDGPYRWERPAPTDPDIPPRPLLLLQAIAERQRWKAEYTAAQLATTGPPPDHRSTTRDQAA
jgi:hypothetical protein